MFRGSLFFRDFGGVEFVKENMQILVKIVDGISDNARNRESLPQVDDGKRGEENLCWRFFVDEKGIINYCQIYLDGNLVYWIPIFLWMCR